MKDDTVGQPGSVVTLWYLLSCGNDTLSKHFTCTRIFRFMNCLASHTFDSTLLCSALLASKQAQEKLCPKSSKV